jgi:hypothetical protein
MGKDNLAHDTGQINACQFEFGYTAGNIEINCAGEPVP